MTFKEAREGKLVNQAEVAAAIGVSVQTVSAWETGRHLPNFKLRKKLNKYFGVKLEWRQNSEG